MSLSVVVTSTLSRRWSKVCDLKAVTLEHLSALPAGGYRVKAKALKSMTKSRRIHAAVDSFLKALDEIEATQQSYEEQRRIARQDAIKRIRGLE